MLIGTGIETIFFPQLLTFKELNQHPVQKLCEITKHAFRKYADITT
jgi:hypothetical protein